MATVYDKPSDLPRDLLKSCRSQPLPKRLLMCPPDFFEVKDVKNPHMEGNIGKVDTRLARRQWDEVAAAFRASQAEVALLTPDPRCEDMVFCANQTFVGLDAQGKPLCVLSNMKHPSRQLEVDSFGRWFSSQGYRVEKLPIKKLFEGSGDAIWHPGRGLIWGGCGFRSEAEVYPLISDFFGVPVIRLPLRSDRFYHLDTCFAALDEKTVLIHPRSLTPDGIAMIRQVFTNVIECDDTEANEGMACNACAIGGKHVVIQRGNARVTGRLRELGYVVHEVDTSEYLKSGGSVFCMKMYVFPS